MAVNLSFIGGAGWQFLDNNGKPLSGGKIYTYLAGTTTPATTYTAWDGVTPNANPIILDAAGRTPQQIWSTEGILYKYVVTTSADVLIRSWDNIGGSVVASDLAQDLASTTDNAKGDALIGFKQANASGFLTGATARTVSTKLQEIVSVKDFGAVGDGVTDDTAAFNAAIAYLNTVLTPAVLHLDGNFVVNGSLTAIITDQKTIDGYSARITHDGGVLFTFGTNVTSSVRGGGVYGLDYFCPTSPTAGTCLVEQKGANRIYLKDISGRVNILLKSGVTGFAGGYFIENTRISTINGTQTVIQHGTGANSQITNLDMTANGVNRVLDETTPTNATATAISFSDAWDTAVWSGLLVNGYLYGLDVNRTVANVNISNFRVTNFYFDFCANGIRLKNTALGGGINNCFFSNGWVTGLDAYGINIDGGSFSSVKFVSVQSMLSGKNNWRVSGSGFTDVSLDSCLGQFANRYNATNTGSDQDDAVFLTGGFSVRNSRFGQSANGFVTTGAPNWQGRYGLNIGPNIINYIIQGNQLEGKTADCSLSYVNNKVPAGNKYSAFVKDNVAYDGATRPAYATVSTEVAPASTALQTNDTPFTFALFIYGGTVSDVSQNGVTVSSSGNITLQVRPGDTWSITYAAAPTLRRFIQP